MERKSEPYGAEHCKAASTANTNREQKICDRLRGSIKEKDGEISQSEACNEHTRRQHNENPTKTFTVPNLPEVTMLHLIYMDLKSNINTQDCSRDR